MHKLFCSKSLLRAAPFLLLFAAMPSHAMPVTYTLSGLFNGSLDGVSFTNTPGLFTLSGSDTDDVTNFGNAFFFNTDGVATFQLGSATPVQILSSTFGVESEYGSASFLDQPNFAVSEYNELTSYDVLTTYGSTTGVFRSYGPSPEQTSGGALVLDGATSDVTFTAAAPASAIMPEPTSLVLTTTGLLGVLGSLRRRLYGQA